MRAQDPPNRFGTFRDGPVPPSGDLEQAPRGPFVSVPPAPERPAAPLSQPRFRHDIPIVAVTVSWDQKVVAAIDAEGAILAWDASSARRLYRRPLLDKGEGPPRLTVSPDNRFLAVSSRRLPAGLLRVLDLTSGREMRRLERGFSPAFSPDGEILAASDGKQLRRWALKSGAELPGLEACGIDLKWVACSPTGDRLAASADGSGVVVVWDLETRRRILPATDSLGALPATSVVFAPDGKTLAVGSHWGVKFVPLVEKDSGPFHGHEEYVNGQLRYSADGRRLAALVNQRRILAWDVLSGRPLFTWAASLMPDATVEVGEGGDTAIWMEEGGIRIERIPRVLAGEADGHVVRCIGFNAEGRVLSGDDRGNVRVWDPADQKEIRRLDLPVERIRFFSRDGRWAVCGGGAAPVRVWDLADGRELLRAELASLIKAVVLSPDAASMALGLSDGSIAIWDLLEKKQRVRISLDLSGVSAIGWSADGKSLAWGDAVGEVVVAEGKRGLDPLRFRTRRRGSAIQTLVFSLDGKLLRAGNAAGELRIYGDPGLEPALVTQAPGGFPPDDRWSATGLLQKAHLRDQNGSVFSVNGSTAVTKTPEGTILLWQAPGGK